MKIDHDIDFTESFLSSDKIPGQGVSPVPPLLDTKEIKGTGVYDDYSGHGKTNGNDDLTGFSDVPDDVFPFGHLTGRSSHNGKFSNARYDYIKIAKSSCNCWACPDCRKKKGYKVRAAIKNKMQYFTKPAMITLTVDPKLHSDPYGAYKYVTSKRYINRLLRRVLGIKYYLWVVEPHELNGQGYPHWHILVDTSHLPDRYYDSSTGVISENRTSGSKKIPNYLNMGKARAFIKKWGIGEQIKLSMKKLSFNDPEHAVNYITKYLVKSSARGPAPWMLNNTGIRMFQPGGIGSLSITNADINEARKELSDEEIAEKKRIKEALRIRKEAFESLAKKFGTPDKKITPADRVAQCRFSYSLVGVCPSGSKEFVMRFLHDPDTLQDISGITQYYDQQKQYTGLCFAGFQSSVTCFINNANAEYHCIKKSIVEYKNKIISAWDDNNWLHVTEKRTLKNAHALVCDSSKRTHFKRSSSCSELLKKSLDAENDRWKYFDYNEPLDASSGGKL